MTETSTSTEWKARLFAYSIVGAGAATVLVALLEADLYSSRLLVFVLLTTLSSLFPIYFPQGCKRRKDTVFVTIATIFVFTSILAFGPAEAALISMVEALVSVWRNRNFFKKAYKVLFNIFQLPLFAYTTGHLFYLLQGTAAPLDPGAEHPVTWVLMTLAACAILYSLSNTGAVAVAISLATGRSLREVWTGGFLSSTLSNFAESATAVVIFLNFQQTAPLALGIALPTAFVIYYAYKMNLTRIDEAQRHLEEVNELYHSTI